jgi:hypothetical protein
MMGLSAISALLGLIGLAVPLIIHLLSNRESKELLFGSIRFLDPQESVNPKSIALTDYGQLLLRCILIAVVVLLAALPYWTEHQSNKQIWIEYGIHADPQYESYLSKLGDPKEHMVFTLGTSDSTTAHYPSLWSAIADANAQKDSVDIITFDRMQDYIGSTIAVSDHVTINRVPHIADEPQVDFTGLTDDERILRMYVDPSSNTVVVITELLDHIADELGLSIVYDDENYDWLITTVPQPIPSDIHALIWEQNEGPLTIRNSTSNTLVVSGAISRSGLLHSDMPVTIGSRLVETKLGLAETDYREMTLPYQTVAANVDNSYQNPLSAWWWLIILPLFLWERYIAHKKHVG